MGSACASTTQAVAPRSTGVWEEDRAGGERLGRSTRTAGTDATDDNHSAAELPARDVQADDNSARGCSAPSGTAAWRCGCGHAWRGATGSYAGATAAWNPTTFTAGWWPGDCGHPGRGRWPDRGRCYCRRNDPGAAADASAAGYLAAVGSRRRHHWRYAPSSRQRTANNGAARTRAADNSSARTGAGSGANVAAKWGSGTVPDAGAGPSAQGSGHAEQPRGRGSS
jgi:hypothetical protein